LSILINYILQLIKSQLHSSFILLLFHHHWNSFLIIFLWHIFLINSFWLSFSLLTNHFDSFLSVYLFIFFFLILDNVLFRLLSHTFIDLIFCFIIAFLSIVFLLQGLIFNLLYHKLKHFAFQVCQIHFLLDWVYVELQPLQSTILLFLVQEVLVHKELDAKE